MTTPKCLDYNDQQKNIHAARAQLDYLQCAVITLGALKDTAKEVLKNGARAFYNNPVRATFGVAFILVATATEVHARFGADGKLKEHTKHSHDLAGDMLTSVPGQASAVVTVMSLVGAAASMFNKKYDERAMVAADPTADTTASEYQQLANT